MKISIITADSTITKCPSNNNLCHKGLFGKGTFVSNGSKTRASPIKIITFDQSLRNMKIMPATIKVM